MPYAALGSSIGAFGDAVLSALEADTTLSTLVGGRIVAATKLGRLTALPLIVGERRELLPGSVAMQKEGGAAGIWLDTWSELNGTYEVETIQARIRAVLSRDTMLTIDGYAMYAGSLACDDEQVFGDFDPDMPQRGLFHGVQHFTADLEEA